tara:strand:+ start:316 stop:714 length:399 start_codon:yes stop_codon:yes gene_type:complete
MIHTCVRCHRELQKPLGKTADYVYGPLSIANDLHECATIEDGLGNILADKIDLELVSDIINSHTEDVMNALENARADDKEDVDKILENENKRLGITVTKSFKSVPVQKTHLICPDCLEPEDTIIWGIDKVDD